MHRENVHRFEKCGRQKIRVRFVIDILDDTGGQLHDGLQPRLVPRVELTEELAQSGDLLMATLRPTHQPGNIGESLIDLAKHGVPNGQQEHLMPGFRSSFLDHSDRKVGNLAGSFDAGSLDGPMMERGGSGDLIEASLQRAKLADEGVGTSSIVRRRGVVGVGGVE
jgi:hypothetical protein